MFSRAQGRLHTVLAFKHQRHSGPAQRTRRVAKPNDPESAWTMSERLHRL
mgnify:CR=1 FL=1